MQKIQIVSFEQISYIVAVVIGISAILSPIVTAFINNCYQIKIKKIDMYELSKRNALENFIKCASRCSDGPSPKDKYDFFDSLNTLYIYFNNVPDTINTLFCNHGADFNRQLTNIVQVLSKQIRKE